MATHYDYFGQRDDTRVVEPVDKAKTSITKPKSKSNLTLSEAMPILMYHHIKNTDKSINALERGLSVPVPMFEEQMQLIHDLGFETMLMKDMTDETLKANEGKKLVITFDDGYEDIYTEAFPIMKQYGFAGVIYLITNDINKKGYLSEKQISELIDAGFEIGSHTLSHPNLASAGIYYAQMQIENSKKNLDAMFEYNVTSFCYPSGKYNDRVVGLLKAAGYTNAVTTVEGFAGPKSNLYTLPRMRVRGTGKLADFAYKILSN
ncbi:MAG: polysaccharide deacetylase family protein [bacterium]|nr:polysaccharide deacetylase family protein [bacterium]